MAAVDSQQTYMPYDPAKDCSQGFCSLYCPQWCYMIFPPPPPFEFDDGSTSSSSSFSPLVIAIIGILASAFLLVTYYTIISKYCGSFDSLRRRLHHGSASDDEQGAGAGVRHQEAWHVALTDGLDDSVIKSIAVCKYKKGDGFVDGTDCSVCLNEFKDDESLRLLPKCSHAFHLQCIDTWLKSHSNCPLCRSIIVTPSAAASAPPLAPGSPPQQERDRPSPQTHHENEVAAALEDLERGRQEEGGDGGSKGSSGGSERGGVVLEMRGEGSASADETDRGGGGGRLSIADVLEMGMEEDPDGNSGDGSSSDRGSGGENGKVRKSGGSHSVSVMTSPVPMKRSFSSGRFSFPRNGRGSNSVLPM